METVGDNPSHLPALGFCFSSFLLHSFGALERVSPFLSSVLFSRLRLGESCWFGELVLNGLHTAGWDFGCFSGRGWTSASCPGCTSANRGLGGKGLDTVRLVPVFALLIQFQCRKSPTH